MSVFRPWRRDVRRDIDEALRFHFEARIAELVAQGMRPEAARAKAIEEFGDVDEVRASLKAIDERVAAQQKRADFLESLWYDARHAARSLWRTPAVSITIILTLALGLGVNTAMFSLLDAILFRPPTGVAEPDGVKRMWSTVKFRSGTQYWSGYSFIEYETVEKVLAGKAEFAIYESPSALPLGRGEEPPEVVAVSPASASFFRLLDVRAAMGRIYSPDEDVLLASENVTVISDRFWAREFNRDPDVVGKLVYFADKPYTVIGVMPAGFSGVELNETEVWVPLGANPSFGPRTRASWTSNPNINGFQVLLAIREGTVPQIEQQLTVALRQPGPGYMSDSTTVARLGSLIKAQGPGRTNTAQQVAERASIVSVLVLIIAFANVVNLLLARAVRRRREIAVRLALGSSAARLLRLLVSESVQLAALAAVAAIGLGTAGRRRGDGHRDRARCGVGAVDRLPYL